MTRFAQIFVSFRNWLTYNKIFFDVFQNVLLGLMAFAISWYSLKISKQEHNLNELKSLPALKIVMIPQKLKDSDFFDTYNLEIDNDGERLSNFNCNIYTFLDIDQTCPHCQGYTNFKVQINDWYSGIHYTNNHTGKLLGTIAYLNNFRLYKLQGAGMVDKPDRETFKIDLKTYLKISYLDIENNSHTEYWEVDFLNSNKIEQNQFQAKTYSNSDSLDSYHLSLYDIGIKDIEDFYTKYGTLTSR